MLEGEIISLGTLLMNIRGELKARTEKVFTEARTKNLTLDKKLPSAEAFHSFIYLSRADRHRYVRNIQKNLDIFLPDS